MWPEELRQTEWESYLVNFPDGRDVLYALKFWMDYLGDDLPHPAIRIRTFKYAMRILHFSAGRTTQTLGWHWKNRVRDFGLKHDPATNEFEIVNMHLWMHALSILRQSDKWHNGVGRLPWVYFLKRIESGCHYNDPIDINDFPPKSKKKIARSITDNLRSRNVREVDILRNAPRDREMREGPAVRPFQPPEPYNPVRNYVFKLTEEM